MTSSILTSESEKPSSSEVSKPKKTFKYIRKDQREPGQRAITVRDTMEALITSYAQPLRKIDQSIPRRDIVISTTFQDNKGRKKRIVSFRDACLPSTSCDALKIKPKRVKTNSKVNALKVKVQQVNGMLKVKVPNSPESELFTNLEKVMSPTRELEGGLWVQRCGLRDFGITGWARPGHGCGLGSTGTALVIGFNCRFGGLRLIGRGELESLPWVVKWTVEVMERWSWVGHGQ
ncbi:hypothetical protein M0R45_026214 [Rubus argutus]|uniref:Uncharacterized protein n=1 Tax=Rubus argutus TaxID=59490 RepID=A0AAW1WYN9_RUBAR